MPFEFQLEKEDAGGRAGRISTDHGDILTPVFMPVGTQATVKATLPVFLRDPIGAQIILGNAYHLFLRPGVDVVEEAGGLHRFMGWDGPILTDSGGYQVFSLADLRKVSDEGVTFRSHVDGSLHLFTPETVMEAQARIGADIIMSFDYCATLPGDRDEVERAVELSTQWARRGRDVVGTRFDRKGYEQVVFGIVQGGSFEDLRRRSMDALLELDFPGYAIGGLSVGEEKDVMWKMTALVTSGLPMDRPRYLMGVGTPLDLIEGVSCGVDMFDCVLPTRNARNGTIFTRDGRMVLRNATYTRDMRAIDEECACMTCRNFTRSYLRHLFVTGEILGPVLATHHSLFFYCDTMREMRSAIQRGDFESWRSDFVERYTANDKKGSGNEMINPREETI